MISCIRNKTVIVSCSVIKDERRPYHQVYDFIFDRLRCVRQEIVISELNDVETLELLEPTIIFLAYSYYQLCDHDISKFDPKICGQHMQECLKKALTCYDSVVTKPGKRPTHSKRPLIESIYLVFNLSSEEARQRALSVQKDPDLQFESTFLASSMISKCCGQGNFYGAIRCTKHLPPLLQGLVYAKHIQLWRANLIRHFGAAYNCPNVLVPNEFVLRTLLLQPSDLNSFVGHFNIERVPPESLRFCKKTLRHDAENLQPVKEIKFTFASI